MNGPNRQRGLDQATIIGGSNLLNNNLNVWNECIMTLVGLRVQVQCYIINVITTTGKWLSFANSSFCNDTFLIKNAITVGVMDSCVSVSGSFCNVAFLIKEAAASRGVGTICIGIVPWPGIYSLGKASISQQILQQWRVFCFGFSRHQQPFDWYFPLVTSKPLASGVGITKPVESSLTWRLLIAVALDSCSCCL